MRALLEAGRIRPDMPSERVFYLQAHYRYERPQVGRLREHHQFGVELVGSRSPRADAEVIGLALSFLGALGLTGLEVHLSSIGDSTCRPLYREALVAYALPLQEELCPDCRRRLIHNPLRLLDCKVPSDQVRMRDAPRISDSLCEACQAHDRELRALLTALGVKVVKDEALVRGLDYYSRTVFEVVNPELGSEGTICGGGRYDGLVELVGGPPTAAVGFGLGLERLLLTLKALGMELPAAPKPDVYIAILGETGEVAVALARDLRESGLQVVLELEHRSLKAQLRQADRLGATRAIIVGPEEVEQGVVAVRDLTGPEGKRGQYLVALSRLVEVLTEESANAPDV
jgi:histidyl-tRNA synthetase